MIHGVINIYKEKGYTSHDVVAKLRGILRQKKIGHTGTLDPDAEGVLPVCLGSGTRLCDMLTDKDKTYRAVMLLGKETDTQDISGTVLKEMPVTVTEEQVKAAAESFIGDYEQIPPMYSALKVNGKKLYELAREGKNIERKARSVKILELTIEEINLPRVTMTVTCSKGTYIRTLCHDIGEKLGICACMEELTRIRVGIFEIQDALRLSEVEELQKKKAEGESISQELLEHIIPVDQMLKQYPAFEMKKEMDRFLYNGNPLFPNQFTGTSAEKRVFGWVRIYDSQGHFCGVYQYDMQKKRYQPVKMFLDWHSER